MHTNYPDTSVSDTPSLSVTPRTTPSPGQVIVEFQSESQSFVFNISFLFLLALLVASIRAAKTRVKKPSGWFWGVLLF